MFERRLAINSEGVGQAVLNIGLRVEAALVGRGVAAPGWAEPGPSVQGRDELTGSRRQGPGAAQCTRRRRAGDDRKRACGSPPTPRANAGQTMPPNASDAVHRDLEQPQNRSGNI